jgi:hypothetical protein
MYLKNFGFEEDVINTMCENIPALAVEKLIENEETVTNNIKYLIDLGVTNYVDAFLKFYNMFLLDYETFDEIFSKYDREDLVAKLEKNVAIMEYL